MDSIVDSFFPVIERVEEEVKILDNLAHDLEDQDSGADGEPLYNMQVITVKEGESHNPAVGWLNKLRNTLREMTKLWSAMLLRMLKKTGADALPIVGPVLRHFRRLRRLRARRHKASRNEFSGSSLGTMTTLLRMTTTRRLVTSLNRLLVAKSDVVGQIQKRLLAQRLASSKHHLEGWSEIATYMGDVQGSSFLQLSLGKVG